MNELNWHTRRKIKQFGSVDGKQETTASISKILILIFFDCWKYDELVARQGYVSCLILAVTRVQSGMFS